MSQETVSSCDLGEANLRPACPLSQVRPGTTVRIKQLAASPDLCQRLREMGFGEEQRIKCLLQNHNVICQVCNVRLGLSAKLADSIYVEPLASHKRGT